MNIVDDQQNAGRAWIRGRLESLATAAGVNIETIEFAPNARALGEILIVRANGQRATADIRLSVLEDLASDNGEQARMEVTLRRLLPATAK